MSGAISRNWDRRIEKEAAALEVYLRDDPVKIRATTRNVSHHGALIVSARKFFSVGSLVDVVFVRRAGNVVHLKRHTAIVVHRHDGGIGLRFCAD